MGGATESEREREREGERERESERFTLSFTQSFTQSFIIYHSLYPSGTSAASLSEFSCLLHESRTTTFVEEEEDTYGTSAARQSASSYLLHESRTNIIVRRDVSICLSSDLSTHAILRSIYLSTDISTTHSISACIHKYL